MIKKLIVAVLILVAAVIGGAFLMPSEVHVERDIVIDAPAAEVFPLVNNFRETRKWSPWLERDPDVKLDFSGPDAGVGAKMEWQSDQEDVGSGSQLITESVADERVISALDFGEMGAAQASFQLDPQGSSTKVTWGLDMNPGNNPIARLMGPMMDGWVGPDYEKGLANLKAVVEASK